MRVLSSLLLAVASASLRAPPQRALEAETDRCTTMAVGAGAGSQGPMATHTSDCLDCDFRVNKVPAADWKDGSVRPLYEYRGSYPATVSSERGETWLPRNLEGSAAQLAAWGEESTRTGTIPQVAHTYALLEAGYGLMNEWGVGIGESTCAARFTAAPASAGGRALLDVRELTRLALERTSTARAAVLLMGELAVALGFYGADWSGGDVALAEAGEALTVVDAREAWMFHVLADDTGASALWVAQRVPDKHITVAANMFVVKEVTRDSPDFLYSDNLWAVALAHGLIPSLDATLNFNLAFGWPRAHSAYCTRRVWRVFSLAAPSLLLPADTDEWGSDYPFSVEVERVLSEEDLMRFQRDHYEGSAFDMTKGLGAGPFGDPQRFDPSVNENGMTYPELMRGGFERAISMFRTTYSTVLQPRAGLPALVAAKVWLCVYAPHASSYLPFYPAQSRVPDAYSRGSLFKYDSSVAFWNFLAAGNYASRFYKFAMVDVWAVQSQLQAYSVAKSRELEDKVVELLSTVAPESQRALSEAPGSPPSSGPALVLHAARSLVDVFAEEQARSIARAWRELLPALITRFHDGYRAEALDQPAIAMHKLFYPLDWLQATGFFNNKPNEGPGIILMQPLAQRGAGSGLLLALAVVLASAALGFALGRHKGRGGSPRERTPLV